MRVRACVYILRYFRIFSYCEFCHLLLSSIFYLDLVWRLLAGVLLLPISQVPMTIATHPTLRRISEGANLAASSLLEISQMYAPDDDENHNFLLMGSLDEYPCVPPPIPEREESQVEEELCSDFVCCGLNLPDLHALLRHYEESHVRVEVDDLAPIISPSSSTIPLPGGPLSSLSIPPLTFTTNNHITHVPLPNATLTSTTTTSSSLLVSSSTASNLSSPSHQGWGVEERLSAFDTTVYRPLPPPGSSLGSGTLPLNNTLHQSPTNHTWSRSQQSFQYNNHHYGSMMNGLSIVPSSSSSSSLFPVRRPRSAPPPLSNLATDINAINTLKAMLPPVLANVSDDNSWHLIRTALSSTLTPRRGESCSTDDSFGREFGTPNNINFSTRERTKKARPYICKVPGCGKTYKNANGLKYHSMHGHERRSGNGEGGGGGGEEGTGVPELIVDKPHRCPYPNCGKRYKNSNGLKYHIRHGHGPNLTVATSQISLLSPTEMMMTVPTTSLTPAPTLTLSPSTLSTLSPTTVSTLSTGLARIEAALKRERALRVQLGQMLPPSDDTEVL